MTYKRYKRDVITENNHVTRRTREQRIHAAKELARRKKAHDQKVEKILDAVFTPLE